MYFHSEKWMNHTFEQDKNYENDDDNFRRLSEWMNGIQHILEWSEFWFHFLVSCFFWWVHKFWLFAKLYPFKLITSSSSIWSVECGFHYCFLGYIRWIQTEWNVFLFCFLFFYLVSFCFSIYSFHLRIMRKFLLVVFDIYYL